MTEGRSATFCKAVRPEDLNLNKELSELDEVIESFKASEITLVIFDDKSQVQVELSDR